MQSMNKIAAVLAGTVAVATLAHVPNAEAATSRIKYVAASAICQATDPSNFTGLRFRTIGVFNASASGIQVACSIPTELVGDQATGEVTLDVHNFRTSAASMNCTVQGGNRRTGVNNYPQTINVGANSQEFLSYSNIDKNNPGSFTHYNISCIIPPNMELSTIRWEEADTGDGL